MFYQHSLKAGECARIYTHTQDKQAMLCSPGIILRISRSSSLSNMLSHKTRTKSPKNAKSLRSCPTLCNPMNHSLPGSSVHGILQARILEWVVISFSRDSQPRDRTLISYISCMSGWFFITSTHPLGALCGLKHFSGKASVETTEHSCVHVCPSRWAGKW